MKKIIVFIFITMIPALTFAGKKTLDERCDAHAKYIIELLDNKYKGESLEEQLDLVNEWDDQVYRENIKNILRDIIYKQPAFKTKNEIERQGLENYIASYRGCIKQYAKD
ncbi:hypothetical protein [Acinetobacter bereziniae]|uniref:hypothetical protein n=1 Tax=Acinetobacter bereziniae TaxID=106648 RepID=UPI002952B88D|nr:hypothetical protein [Acinetobacter bereziniae]MDV8155193.1 hypothetical protein [Acinetobacter bereziniae]